MNEGTSSALVRSGLQESKWAEGMECYCYLRNAQDLLADGQTRYERRFNSPFNEPIIPFGADVRNFPISLEDQRRVHHFGTNVLRGIFIGYPLNALGGWTGDLLRVDTEDLKNNSTIKKKKKT